MNGSHKALVPPSMLGLLDGGEVSRWKQDAKRIACLPPEIRTGKNDETLRYQQGRNTSVDTTCRMPRSFRDFYAFESHVKHGFEKRGEPMPQEWVRYFRCIIKRGTII